MDAPSDAEKVRENRLQRMAKRLGLEVRASSRRNPRALDQGMYALVQSGTGSIVAGFTLDNIEEYLVEATRADAERQR